MDFWISNGWLTGKYNVGRLFWFKPFPFVYFSVIVWYRSNGCEMDEWIGVWADAWFAWFWLTGFEYFEAWDVIDDCLGGKYNGPDRLYRGFGKKCFVLSAVASKLSLSPPIVCLVTVSIGPIWNVCVAVIAGLIGLNLGMTTGSCGISYCFTGFLLLLPLLLSMSKFCELPVPLALSFFGNLRNSNCKASTALLLALLDVVSIVSSPGPVSGVVSIFFVWAKYGNIWMKMNFCYIKNVEIDFLFVFS